MEVEKEPKKEISAGKWGCIIAVIILILLIIAFFAGVYDFREINNWSESKISSQGGKLFAEQRIGNQDLLSGVIKK